MITTLPIKIIAIGDDGFHLSAKIYLNGKVANVIVDTGASKTVFGNSSIQKYVTDKKFKNLENLSIGLGSKKIKSKSVTINKIKIGTIKIANYTTILLDLSHINDSYKEIGLKPIDGILGSDILNKYNAIIDYKKRIIKLKQN